MTASIDKSSLRDLIRRDGVGAVWCGGHEILQRIFVTVRDRNWQEIAPSHWRSEVDEVRGTVALSGRHESDSVGFEWGGTLRVSEDRRHLRFEMAGRVLRDMEICRLGLVVLHPVVSMVGSQVVTDGGPQASAHSMTVAAIIAPQPVKSGIPVAMTEPFSRLRVERSDFGRLELEFEGDLFELEDQRNWGDASFKTYCTPLRVGFPRWLKAGTEVRHSVEVRFSPGTRGAPVPTSAYSGVFPRIGCEAGHPGAALHASGHYDPAWDHVHVDASALENVAELHELLAAGTSPRLQIALEARDDVMPRSEVVALLLAHQRRIARLLMYGSRTSLPSAAAVTRWRHELETAGLSRDIAVLAATKGHFVEFNRGGTLNLSAAGIAFPLTATVHADDAEMIGENVGAIREMADTARNRTRAAEIAVAPLALYYPRSVPPRNFPAGLAAPWLAATLIHAGLGDVQSITLAEDVIASVGAAGSNVAGFVLRLLGCAGRKIEPLTGGVGLPRSLHAVAFTSAAPGEPRALLANVSSREMSISLPGMTGESRAVTNAVTGESFVLRGGELEVPGFGVTLIA